MPLKELISGLSQVPEEIRRIADGLPYRDFITIGLLVKHIKLKNKTKIKTLGNIIPDCWIYVQDEQVDVGRIQIFNNWSPYLVNNPQENIWIGLEYFCDENSTFWNRSDNELKNSAENELKKMGFLHEQENILDFKVVKVKKAYPAYFDTYDRIDSLREYLDSIENLYCIGRNGQHRYNNMDHSMATAFAAVRNIVEGNFRDKSTIWEVNTENEYQE